MNNQQDNKKIEKIPVRQPDGTFSMIQVSSVQSDIPRKTNEEEVIKNQDKEVVTDLPKEKIPPKVLKEKPIVTPKVSLVKKDDSQKQKVIDQQVIKKDSQRQEGIDWQGSVEKVMSSISIELFDENAERRLRSIILSRLRDVRDFLATKETLTKGRDGGGLGLDEADAASVINSIEAEYKLIHNKNSFQTSDKLKTNNLKVEDLYQSQAKLDALVDSDIPYVESNEYLDAIANHVGSSVKTDKPADITKPSVAKEIELPEDLEQEKSLNIKSKPKDVRESVEQTKKEMSKILMMEALKKQEQEKKKKKPVEKKVVKPEPEVKPKPTMTDVVSKKRLVGPIDELRSMRLVDFHRLGNSTEERLQKVKEHIEEMEDVSFSKKVEAIKAWRSNPIYQMYVNLGSQSLMGTQTVEEVIKEKQNTGEETLSREEFEQLTDFNKQLRF